MRNFDTIPRLVRTVDGEILSEIAIPNFEKKRKIETRILPYGRQHWHFEGKTFHWNGVGNIDSSTTNAAAAATQAVIYTSLLGMVHPYRR